ncbi:MAG: radical SAM protein [Rubricoccaceae bacterium]|nr:radical SAM protein [Rubricoccaceae bacterium]
MRPVLCNYYVTYRCNATCGFCDIWEQPSPLIREADVARNLDDLRRLGVRIIDFTGGEPLLHPQMDRLLRMAKARGFLTTLTTNGLLYPRRAERLKGLIDLLHVSIDSPVPAEHDASRGVRSFDKVMESVAVALALGERPDLLFTVTNENAHHLETVYETITRPNGLILIVNPLFAYNGLGEGLDEAVMAKARAFARKPYVYLNPAFLTLRARGGNDPARPDCRAVSTSVVISPFDELVLPCYHAGLEKLPIEGRLYDLWHSDRVAWHRTMEGRHAACAGCAINCYFEPSMALTPTSGYFWESLPSKARYVWTKWVVQRLSQRLGPKAAVLPDLSGYAAPPPTPDGGPAGDGAAGDGAAEDLIALPVLKAAPQR